MHCNRKVAALAFGAAVLACAPGSANAACSTAAAAGTWFFYDLQGTSPGIKTNVTSVTVNATTKQQKNLETFTFTNTNTGYSNNTADVIKCTLTVKNTGTFTAPCTSYGVDGGVHNTTASGTIALNAACALSGTITVAGDPSTVTIQGGQATGTVAHSFASGIATQGTRVHHFTLVKQ